MSVIRDDDSYYVIDPDTRLITKESGANDEVVQYDNNSERFSFKIPSTVEGFDVSNYDKIEIHYINTSSGTSVSNRESNEDVYEVDDLVASSDENYYIFTWLLSQNGTQFAGTIKFQIHFLGSEEQTWSTKVYSAINVAEGLNCKKLILEKNPDIIKRFEERVATLETQYDRKFDDIIPVEYEEPVFATVTESGSTDNFAVKIAEFPENTTPSEVVNNFVGWVKNGEETRIDDKELFTIAERAEMKIINFGAKDSGAMFCRNELPIFIVTNTDNLRYALRIIEYGETYIYRFVFPEKGIYASAGREPDENGVMKYKSFDKILFRDVQQIDEKLIPAKYATIDDIPKNPDVLAGFTYEDEKLLYNGNPIEGAGVAGSNGLSAYEIAVENGFEGTETEWLESLKGKKGDKGDNGKAATINGENAFNFEAGYGLSLVKSGTFHILASHTEWKSENNPTSISLLPNQTKTISSLVEHLEVSIDDTNTASDNMFETDFAFTPSENCELVMPTNVKWAFETPPNFKQGYIYYIHIKKVQYFYIASFVEVIN